MVIEYRDVRFVVDPDKCCGCKKCIRTCQEDVWRWDEDECLGHSFEIVPLSVMLSDPLENRIQDE